MNGQPGINMKNNFKDITGITYNYLTAIEKLPNYSKGKRLITPWKFSCICGNEIIRESADVKSGGTKSCGCKTKELMRKAKQKPEGVAAANNLYASYMLNCVRDRGYEFELTKVEFLNLTTQNCYYCDKPPSQIKKSKISQYVYNGIDRVDNSKGYLKNNVVACCIECNSNKSGVSLHIINKVIEFINRNKNE